MRSADDISRLDSEGGIIATLIHNPEFYFHCEQLLPAHFTNKENRIVYCAIAELVSKGIYNIDAYNILEILNASDATKKYAREITISQLNDLIDVSPHIARSTVEEYKVMADNVIEAAFRRDAFERLRRCEDLCFLDDGSNIAQKIYDTLDEVMVTYSTNEEVPPYSERIDECWQEIEDRQASGSSGIPFKFPALNNYVTMEKGELVVFAAEQKQGKSMMLLNCAVELMKQDYAVLYLDSELSTRLFTARLLAHLTGIEYRRLVSGNYDDDERASIYDAIAWVKTRKFTHVYIPMFDLQSIYTAVKKVQHTQGLDVLVVDYFKSKGEGDAWSSYAELGRFVDMVKNQIAGDMDIAAIGAAQATSTGKIADSAKIGRNASTICIIQEKTLEEIERDGPECGNKKLRVIFNRNGAQMSGDEYIDLWFDGNHISYEQAKQHVPETPY